MTISSEVTVYVNHPEVIESEIKESLDTSLDYTYDQYVEMGKKIVKTIEVYQAKLAYLACKVCQIRHGGRSDGYYTITDYANDLGINAKTLQQWTLTYRNVLAKLDIKLEDVTKEVWRAANRVNDNLTWRNTIDNKTKGTHRKRLQYKKDYPSEIIREMYHNELGDEPSFESELRGWTQYLRNIRNKIDKRDLNLAHEGNLLELMNNLDYVSEKINDFLSKKNKKVVTRNFF